MMRAFLDDDNWLVLLESGPPVDVVEVCRKNSLILSDVLRVSDGSWVGVGEEEEEEEEGKGSRS